MHVNGWTWLSFICSLEVYAHKTQTHTHTSYTILTVNLLLQNESCVVLLFSNNKIGVFSIKTSDCKWRSGCSLISSGILFVWLVCPLVMIVKCKVMRQSSGTAIKHVQMESSLCFVVCVFSQKRQLPRIREFSGFNCAIRVCFSLFVFVIFNFVSVCGCVLFIYSFK